MPWELPDPLHPAVVHLPIALAVLVPAFALLGILAIEARLVPARTWCVVVLLQAALAGSAWLAHETGEEQEERVEDVVAERPIEDHQEAADRLLKLAFATLAVSAAGLLPKRAGTLGRFATLAAAGIALAAGISVGRSGGELVYRHGAANAYIGEEGAAHGAVPDRASRARIEHEDDDDD